MPSTPAPTPEEVEAARALVATADAQAEAERRAASLLVIKPLTDIGLGGDSPPNVTLREFTAALRENASALGKSDTSLQQLAFSTAQVLETLDDRVRSIVARNAPAPSQD